MAGSPRAAIGLIVLATDQTDRARVPPAAGCAGRRVLREPDPERRRRSRPRPSPAMEGRLTEAADLILPGLPLDVVAFGCTSASMVIGEEQVFARSARRARAPRAPRRSPPRSPPSRRSRAPARPAHAVSRRHQPLHARLHRGARLRRPGHGLVQRGGRPQGGAHRPGLDPRRGDRSRPRRTRSMPCSSRAPACA